MDLHEAHNTAELIELLDHLVEEAGGNQIAFAFQDGYADPILFFHDEDGLACYQTTPSDDPDDKPLGYVSDLVLTWPLTRLVPASALPDETPGVDA
jgi:hypothetical protein